MTFNWFTYKEDGASVLESVKSVQAVFPDSSSFVWDDDRAPVADSVADELRVLGVAYARTTWNRGGNLNGIEAVRGILHCLEASLEATHDYWAVKIDSDILVLRKGELAFVDDPGVDVIGGYCTDNRYPQYFHGALYALRSKVVHILKAAFDAPAPDDRLKTGDPSIAEDVLISRACYRLLPEGRVRNTGSFDGGTWQGGWAYGAPSTRDPRNYYRHDVLSFGHRYLLDQLTSSTSQHEIQATTMAAFRKTYFENAPWEMPVYMPAPEKVYLKTAITFVNDWSQATEAKVAEWERRWDEQGWGVVVGVPEAVFEASETLQKNFVSVICDSLDTAYEKAASAYKEMPTADTWLRAEYVVAVPYDVVFEACGGYDWNQLFQIFEATAAGTEIRGIAIPGYTWECLDFATSHKTGTATDKILITKALAKSGLVLETDIRQFCFHRYDSDRLAYISLR